MAEAAAESPSGGRDGHESRPSGREAFVTMVTNDDFVIGAEVMLHSLREHCCNSNNSSKPRRRPLVVMVTSEVSQMKRQALQTAADEVIEVKFCGVSPSFNLHFFTAHKPSFQKPNSKQGLLFSRDCQLRRFSCTPVPNDTRVLFVCTTG